MIPLHNLDPAYRWTNLTSGVGPTLQGVTVYWPRDKCNTKSSSICWSNKWGVTWIRILLFVFTAKILFSYVQGNIRHCMFPRDYTAPNVPEELYGTKCSLGNIRHRMLPYSDWTTTLYGIFRDKFQVERKKHSWMTSVTQDHYWFSTIFAQALPSDYTSNRSKNKNKSFTFMIIAAH